MVEVTTRPLVFLDIDGVLVTARSWRTPSRFDGDAVAALNLLTERIGAAIVLSSTWRFMPRVVTILREAGVKGVIVGKTPHLYDQPRGAEIKAWLVEHRWDQPYVILDDDADMDGLADHLVRTTWDLGLTLSDVDVARSFLLGRKT